MCDELVKALRCEQYGDDECLNVECPYWSDLGCRNGVANREAADAIERLTAQLPAWISVEERQPEQEGKYLVCFKDGAETIFDTAWFTRQKIWSLCHWENANVTYWMPLPQAPDLT